MISRSGVIMGSLYCHRMYVKGEENVAAWLRMWRGGGGGGGWGGNLNYSNEYQFALKKLVEECLSLLSAFAWLSNPQTTYYMLLTEQQTTLLKKTT